MSVWDPDKNAVKQALAEFRSDPAALKRYISTAMEFGFFLALDLAQANAEMKPALFEHEFRRYHDSLLPEIGEAKKLIPHIRMALERLETACRHGRERRHIKSVSTVPDVVNVKESIHVLQGWLATLFARYLKFYAFVHGSGGAEAVIRSWAADSWDIVQTRKLEQNVFNNHDELFQHRLMDL
ncbi:MAG TPA: hypothetical protein VMH28_17590 [Candidatus Acidoferrales bacterium]|nr:hypothetical protein [Candidatus Acidoferrales bacterium]